MNHTLWYLQAMAGSALLSLLTGFITASFCWDRRRHRDRHFLAALLFTIAAILAFVFLVCLLIIRYHAYTGDVAGLLGVYKLAMASSLLFTLPYLVLHSLFEGRLGSRKRGLVAVAVFQAVVCALFFFEAPWAVFAGDQVTLVANNVTVQRGAGAALYFIGLIGALVYLSHQVTGLLRRSRYETRWLLYSAGFLSIAITGLLDVLWEWGLMLTPFPVVWIGFGLFHVAAFVLISRNYSQLLSKVEAHVAEIEKLNRELLTDGLTGLYSKGFLENVVRKALSERDSDRQVGGILFIDLDNFKQINDRYGHYRGDEVLLRVADLIRLNVREGDIACRWGGDEFVVYYRELDPDATRAIAERLRSGIEVQRFAFAGEPVSVTVSLGYAALHPGESWREVLERADRALYAAKAQGKNRIAVDRDGPQPGD